MVNSKSSDSFPKRLPIEPLKRAPNLTLRVPGSKSITNRALILAALASHHGNCTLTGVLHSEDTHVMIDSLTKLGFHVDAPEENDTTLRVRAVEEERIVPAEQADLFIANSGTSMRFLTALAALGHGRYRLDGIARMRERPIGDLLTALRQLGVEANSEMGNGCPPVLVRSQGMRGGAARIRGDVSSQFLSGLLMAAPIAQGDVRIVLDGPLVSKPYVDLTVGMMREFGGVVEREDDATFVIPGRQCYKKHEFLIEPDASAASYFFAAAAITQGTIRIEDLGPSSVQGDVRFVDLLQQMGCEVRRDQSAITVIGRPLHGIDVDMSDVSDTVMTLAAVACFAEGATTIRNVAHVRHKETDRLHALTQELRRVGAEVEERDDGLTIAPQPIRGALIETYNDHRMAMSMALLGLRTAGIVIHEPVCVAKTYPGFFEDLNRLRD